MRDVVEDRVAVLAALVAARCAGCCRARGGAGRDPRRGLSGSRSAGRSGAAALSAQPPGCGSRTTTSPPGFEARGDVAQHGAAESSSSSTSRTLHQPRRRRTSRARPPTGPARCRPDVAPSDRPYGNAPPSAERDVDRVHVARHLGEVTGHPACTAAELEHPAGEVRAIRRRGSPPRRDAGRSCAYLRDEVASRPQTVVDLHRRRRAPAIRCDIPTHPPGCPVDRLAHASPQAAHRCNGPLPPTATHSGRTDSGARLHEPAADRAAAARPAAARADASHRLEPSDLQGVRCRSGGRFGGVWGPLVGKNVQPGLCCGRKWDSLPPRGPGWRGSSHSSTPARTLFFSAGQPAPTMAFRGTFDHTLDAKNRLTVPSKFRATLSDGVVIAKGIEGCAADLAPGRRTRPTSRAPWRTSTR